MNTYKKFCPNVFVAKCSQEHKKGDTIIVTTRHGKENECIVHNLVGKNEEHFFYSITRADGYDTRKHYEEKAERYQNWAASREEKSDERWEAANEGREFLSLAEPIKIGHHSERRHRALIERNHRRMEKAVEHSKKAEEHQEKADRYERMTEKIDLSMPESLEFFEIQLEEAIAYHQGLKDGSIKREHSYSLTYAGKRVKDLRSKHETAVKLWA